MNAPKYAHSDVRARIPYFAVGILDETDTSLIEDHLRGCAECRATLEQTCAAIAQDDGHLPEEWLIHWDRKSRELEGLQRELTRRHLGECSSCRELMRDFGHDPELPHVESLEANARVMALLPSVAQVQSQPAEKPSRPTRAIVPGWVYGAFAGGGIVAAAAAFLLVASPGLRGGGDLEHPVAPLVIQQPRLGIRMGSGAPEIVASLQGDGAELRGTRGEADTVFQLRSGQKSVRVGLPQQAGLPAATVVEVQVLGADSVAMDRVAMTYGDLLRGDRGLILSSDAPLEPGRFVIRLTWLLGDGVSRGHADYVVDLTR